MNADILFYHKVKSLIELKFGMNVLPDHGKLLGSDRDWAILLKNRFENGRRTNAKVRTAGACAAPCSL